MNPRFYIQNSLPDDIALKIVSSLKVSDVCSLGSCSKIWRDLCGSDSVWVALCKQRWGVAVLDQVSSPNFKGWREFYMAKHAEMRSKATVLIEFVEQRLSLESIEAAHYLKVIHDMCLMQFGFQDLQIFFLKPKLNVLLNLASLHYCIMYLPVPMECISEALRKHNISEREICVQWWTLGRWLHGFRPRDEMHSRSISLGDLATYKETEVLRVLHRGAIHEVLRVHVYSPKPTCTPW